MNQPFVFVNNAMGHDKRGNSVLAGHFTSRCMDNHFVVASTDSVNAVFASLVVFIRKGEKTRFCCSYNEMPAMQLRMDAGQQRSCR